MRTPIGTHHGRHEPDDCPICGDILDRRQGNDDRRVSDADADRAADEYYQRLADIADRRFR